MVFHKGPGSARVTTVERADHSNVVAYRDGSGWVQKSFYSRKVEYAQRSFVTHGVTSQRFYRPYTYHGALLSYYAPVRYYPPAFYAWAYRPWGPTVRFNWGWQTRPWYGYYGSAFAPYAYYNSGSMWMTDYMLANSMDLAYQRNSGMAVGTSQNLTAQPAVAPMPPEVKDQINQEVRLQMTDLQNQRNGNGLATTSNPRAGALAEPSPRGSISDVLADNREHTFVNGTQLLPIAENNTECVLTEGDTVRYSPPPPATNVQIVKVTVMWSKQSSTGECAAGSQVSMGIQDLQEMQNFMLAAIDEGSGKMHTEMAKGTIPTAPGLAGGPPSTQTFTQDAPPVPPDTQAQVNAQNQQADQTEQITPKS